MKSTNGAQPLANLRPDLGLSLRRSFGEDVFSLRERFNFCEIVPENWDPEVAADRDYLERVAATFTPLLHCLTLNVLGDSPQKEFLKRTRAWLKILNLDQVSDHFSWTAYGERHLGVFIPKPAPLKELAADIDRVRDLLGCELILENIALSSGCADSTRRYHETLVEVCQRQKTAILADLENIRLDAWASGLPVDEILSIYAGADIASYHVAGSEIIEDLAIDSHAHPVPEATLELARRQWMDKPRPVIYEKDYQVTLESVAREGDALARALTK